ncbi:MAG: proteasome subunit beta [Candidatus Lokiarchaeota archaeon]|nr:proteasome subunit beta [Candidatus Lokiarchaeota archaeon]
MMENKPNKLNIDEDTLNKIIRSSTTTVGIMVKDGVVVGTESQATAGYTVATKTAQKLFQINDYTCATISGGVADCQYVVNQLKALSNLKQVEGEKVPDPQYIASITRNILFSGRSYFLCMMIVGGYSLKKKSGILCGVDLLGTLYEEENFISFGSGSPFSIGVLEADWKPNMTKAAGINLIKTAISSSRERDAASGFDIQICTIDKTGYNQVQ